MKIQILSDEMASRIAAGEVVERPASVVKELLENSLDAGATEIFLSIEKSGTSLIQVSDNGEGMAPEDLTLAVERHATSKLKADADLFRIATLGFRGEALPSIGSVAKMEIISRSAQAPMGHRLRVDGGKRDELRPTAASFGTTIEIKDIFFNTPARRKFLKAPATELSHICDVLNRMALANPSAHFRLQHDGRTVADYISVADGQDRLYQVFGREIAKGLAPFRWSQGDLAVHGFLSVAPTSFPNARYLFTFVNRRYVRDKVLTHAVIQGYETLLMKGQYPAVVLFLDLPFEDVDVNVHPAKYEVRFRRQSDVHEAVARAIRQALRQEAKDPSAQSSTYLPGSFSGVRETPLPYGVFSVLASTQNSQVCNEVFVMPTAADVRHEGFFASMRILGQILGCYLICASAKGLALIDQHAAHERVAFEKLRQQLNAGQVAMQTLLMPQIVELSAGETMLLEQKLGVLERFGFALEPFGPSAYAVTAAPALLPEGDYGQVVRQMVADLADVNTSEKLRAHLEDRLATIACHSVIRANRILEMDEMRALLRDLDQIDFATQCPHGRPVLIEISRDELERMFKRVL
ncbi:MAG TPA: DNA mismatch repair endonuclease MutL [Candidatus Binatia bacterium]